MALDVSSPLEIERWKNTDWCFFRKSERLKGFSSWCEEQSIIRLHVRLLFMAFVFSCVLNIFEPRKWTLNHVYCFPNAAPCNKLSNMWWLSLWYLSSIKEDPVLSLTVAGIFKSTCRINMRWFPFDVQKCELKFGSWTHGSWSLDLQMLEADISNYIPSGEWDLIGKRDQGLVALEGSQVHKWTVFPPDVKGQVNQQKYQCCQEMYPDVTFTVVMRRRTLYYGLNLLLPCVLINTLALLVFVLPAESGEKITLGLEKHTHTHTHTEGGNNRKQMTRKCGKWTKEQQLCRKNRRFNRKRWLNQI